MGRMIKMPLFEAEKLECSSSGNHRWFVIFVLCQDYTTLHHLPEKTSMSSGELFWSDQDTEWAN